MTKKKKKQKEDEMMLEPASGLELDLEHAKKELDELEDYFREVNYAVCETLKEVKRDLKNAERNLRYLKKQKEKECS